MAYHVIVPSHRTMFLTCAQQVDMPFIIDRMLRSCNLHLGAAYLHDSHGQYVRVCQKNRNLHANAQLASMQCRTGSKSAIGKPAT